MKYRVWLLAACLAAGSGFAAPTEDESVRLAPIVVTATRTATRSDQVIAPVVVIGRDEIERSLGMDVAELLRFHGGLEVARNGGPGQVTSIFIRGAESDHTLLLLDGVRINDGTSGVAAIQNLSPDLVERIEIVKGPRSALYGSEAVGGVINIITRGAEAPVSVRAEAGGGKYSTRKAAGELAWRGDSVATGVNLSWLETDGFPTLEASNDDAGYDNTSFNAWADAQLGRVHVTTRHWQSSGTTEYSDFFLLPVDQDYTNRASQVDLRSRPISGWQTALSVSRVVDDIEQGKGAFNPSDFTKTDRISVDWQNTVTPLAGLELVAGLYHSSEETSGIIFGSRLEDSPGAGDVDTDVDAGYLQAIVTRGPHQFLAAFRHTDHDEFGPHNSWNAEYGWDLAGGLRFTAGAGRAFRAPSSLDLYGFGGNPDLDPEIARSWDFAFSQRLADNQTLRIGAFKNRIDDLIQFVFTDPDNFVGQNINTEKAVITGTEISYSYSGRAWRFRSEVTIQDPEDRTNDQQLLRRSRNILTVSLGRAFGPHEFGLDILATDEREDFGGARLAGYVLANLTGSFEIGHHWRLRAKVENLLNQDYQLADGYRSAERGIYATLAYTH